MSKVWSDSEKAKMRATYEEHMTDACKICTRSVSYNAVGEDIESFTEASTETPCGLEMKGGNENLGSTGEVIWEATLRLPITTPLSAYDRIHVTKLKGESADIMYQVAAPIEIGIAGKVVRLRKVQL